MNRKIMMVAQAICISVIRLVSSPWTYIILLALIVIGTLLLGRSGAKADAQTLIANTLSLAQTDRVKKASESACAGSNLPVWLSKNKVTAFQVGEFKSSTKVNGAWAIPVYCKVQIQGKASKEVIFYLNSLTSDNQCIVAVE